MLSTLDPLREPLWDRRLERWSDATVFHTQAWARVLCETYGYRPRYLADASDGLLPVMEVSSRLTGRRLVSLPFTDEVSALRADPAALEAFRGAALDQARADGARYLELRTPQPGLPASTRFYGHQLNLHPGASSLLQRCSSATRRALRKAESSGLSVQDTTTVQALRCFYDLVQLTRQRQGVPPQPLRFYEAIRRHLLETGRGRLVLVYHGDRPIAGTLFLHHGAHAIYKFGASDHRHQHLRANNLAMWTGIRSYADAGFHTLDFGRTSLDNDGLRAFKLGWGTDEREVTYHRFDLRTGAWVQARDQSSGWHTAWFRRLPRPVNRWLGTLLYPHWA